MGPKSITLTKAIEGFLLHKAAEGRSQHTLADYDVCLHRLADYTGNSDLRQVSDSDLRRFFAHLSTDYRVTPSGIIPRPEQKLSPKTIRNIHAAISSLFTWAVEEELVEANPMQRIQRPKNHPPPIEPLTQDEVVALLRALKMSDSWDTRPTVRHRRTTAARDQAIVLLLLDTGLRASELCNLNRGDFDQKTGHVTVHNGKGGKSRTVRAEKATCRAIWSYLITRPDDLCDDDPLFALSRGREEQPMNRNALYLLLKRAGKRAGVRNVYPHKFRHTFAIEYLRNGGDIYTLQAILGHSSLDMVRRYLAIVQADLDAQHRSASPVRNWRL